TRTGPDCLRADGRTSRRSGDPDRDSGTGATATDRRHAIAGGSNWRLSRQPVRMSGHRARLLAAGGRNGAACRGDDPAPGLLRPPWNRRNEISERDREAAFGAVAGPKCPLYGGGACVGLPPQTESGLVGDLDSFFPPASHGTGAR